jgi:hypothetical protein
MKQDNPLMRKAMFDVFGSNRFYGLGINALRLIRSHAGG